MFYIQPPNGQIALHTLEKCIFTRLEYLSCLYHDKTESFNGNFEYLLEDSIYDATGHFTLRLLASTSTDLWTYWLTRETLFFKKRLKYISQRQVRRLFKRIVKDLSNKEDTLINQTLINISNYFLQSTVLNHIFTKNHSNDCTEHQITIRFELVSDLLKIRLPHLSRGYAVIFCSMWKEMLESLFKNYIDSEMKANRGISRNVVNYDIRLNLLNRRVQYLILKEGYGCGLINFEDIDREALNFPPCMLHFHKVLRERHRLSHYSRFYYSLFLKDCGMNLDNSINYWKDEYSKPHSCGSNCVHNWQSDQRKFLYSIRHLYGLEGSRKNYKTPNCKNICSSVHGTRYEGGCPFKEFDRDALKLLLNSTLVPESEVETFLEEVVNKKPEEACTAFFSITRKNKNGNIIISSPVQYYLMMIDPNQ